MAILTSVASVVSVASGALPAGAAPLRAAEAPPANWKSKVVRTEDLGIAVPGLSAARAASTSVPSSASAPSTTAANAAARRRAASAPRVAPPATDPVWARIRQCESGNRYALSTGNGYYGAYQFAAGTWKRLGFPGLPHEAAPEVQDEAARLLYVRSGWGVWGACARRLGLT